MKFEKTHVYNFENAIRGMRNPHNSWQLSDSFYDYDDCNFDGLSYKIGPKDLKLAQTLIKSGSEHRKFMRQIFVSVDITAPLYWWKQFDQYKVGVTSDSCSTMHTLHKAPITLECFETDDFNESVLTFSVEQLLASLDQLRLKYLETKDKRYWIELIRWLPESWLQLRTVTMSYENVLNMIQQRVPEKLDDWHKYFFPWAHTLPYADELLFIS